MRSTTSADGAPTSIPPGHPETATPAGAAPGFLRYWAFISYSHVDKAWAKWVHEALERYRVPRALVGRPTPFGPAPRRLYPSFRDRAELPSVTSLTDAVTEALDRSRYLIVVCSPHAAASRWVREEVMHFKRLGRAERIFCVLVGGEPNAEDKPEKGFPEALPDTLRFRIGADGALTGEREDPLAADLRPGGDGRFKARLKLLAGMLGVGFNDLYQRDRRRRRQQRLVAAAGIVTVSVALGGIWADRQRALERQRTETGAMELAAAAEQSLGTSASALERSALLTVESLRTAPTLQGFRSAFAVLGLLPERPVTIIPGERIGQIVLSRDGRRVATAARAGAGGAGSSLEMKSAVKVWDSASGNALVQLTVDGLGTALALSSNGSLVAVAGESDLAVWSVDSGSEILRVARPGGDERRALDLAFAAADRSLVELGSDGALWAWDLRTTPEPLRLGEADGFAIGPSGDMWAFWSGDQVHLVEPRMGVRGLQQDRPVTALALSADAGLLASGGSGTVRLWDRSTGAPLKQFAYPGTPSFLAFDAAGKRLTAGGGSGARVWRLASGEERGFAAVSGLEEPPPELKAIDPYGFEAWSPDGRFVAAIRGATVHIRDAGTGRELLRLPHGHGVDDIAFSADGGRVVTEDRTGRLRAWTLQSGAGTRLPHSGTVTRLAFSPGGSLLAAVSLEGGARLWDLEDGSSRELGYRGSQFTWSLDGTLSVLIDGERALVDDGDSGDRLATLEHQAPIWHSVFTPDGRWLATMDFDGTVRLWSTSDWSLTLDLPGEGRLGHLAVSPTGERLVIATGEKTTVHALPSGTVLYRLDYPAPVARIAFRPDGDSFATMSGSGVRLWRTETGAAAGRLLHDAEVRSLAFAPDGRKAVTVAAEEILVWDLFEGHTSLRIPYPGESRDVRFTRDGTGLVAARGQALSVYDPRTGKLLLELEHGAPLSSFALSPDGRWLATGGDDGTARVWPWGAQALIATLCQRLERNLTNAEWGQYFPLQSYRDTCPSPWRQVGIPTHQ